MSRRWLAFLSIGALSVVVFIFFVMRLRPIEIPEPSQDIQAGSISQPTITFVNPSLGPQDAKVTVVVFSDFECEACKTFATSLEVATKTYPKDLRVVWKDLPNESLHPLSTPSAIAAHCADRQGKFWEYHDALFTRQSAISETQFPLIANELELDVRKFQTCYDERDTLPIVRKDYEEGIALGITSTPAFYIGEDVYIGAMALENLLALVQSKL
jgi:protein-disulfide isomerase